MERPRRSLTFCAAREGLRALSSAVSGAGWHCWLFVLADPLWFLE